MIFLENEIVYGRSFPVPKLDDFVLPIGKARVVRTGKDVTLVAYSISVGLILEAAEKLAKDGIDAEIIDLRTLRPLDTATVIESVKKTNRIVTVEQGWPICSIGSEICCQVVEKAFDYLDAPPTKVTGKDVPMPYAANLEKLALPQSTTSSRRSKPSATGLMHEQEARQNLEEGQLPLRRRHVRSSHGFGNRTGRLQLLDVPPNGISSSYRAEGRLSPFDRQAEVDDLHLQHQRSEAHLLFGVRG